VLDSIDAVVGHDARRSALRVIVLRRLDRVDEARDLLEDALRMDPLDATLRVLAGIVPDVPGLLLDTALDLHAAGEDQRALDLLARISDLPVDPSGNSRPLAHYLSARILEALGRADAAAAERSAARSAERRWAFPAGLDALDALDAALVADPADSVARHLRGMLLYGHGRRVDAADDWDRAIADGMTDPVLLRNAALAAYNVRHDDTRAWQLYEQAIGIAPDDARLRYEQDQLALRLGHTAQERRARLDPVRDLVLTRDDLTIAYLGLLIDAGDAAEALRILESRPFHPWEGGEGQALAVWDAAHAALGLELVDPPASLGETRTPYTPPVARHEDGVTDYFATSLPELLLFAREQPDD